LGVGVAWRVAVIEEPFHVKGLLGPGLGFRFGVLWFRVGVRI